MSSAAVEVLDQGVRHALVGLRHRLEDLESTWEQIGGRVVEVVTPFVPVESGALVDDLKAEPNRDGIRLVIGEGVPYAGVINFGWGARNIDAARFMDKAGPALEQVAPEELAQEIQGAIDALGLS